MKPPLDRPRVSAALAFAALAGACSGDEPGTARPPNVVVVTVDTLRADHLGSYGYPHDTSPRMDALAAGATRYADAVATSSWTIPSHASLFTGRFPFQHGAHAVPVGPGASRNERPLSRDEHTLAEVLAGVGYRTGAFVANRVYLGEKYGFDQGFEDYHVEADPDRKAAPMINERVLPWLDEHAGRPFFLWVNYMDTHRPYSAEGWRGLSRADFERSSARLLSRLVAAVRDGGEPPDPRLVERVVERYDAAVAGADAGVGALIDRLVELGAWDDTVFVVTSDHGEYFGEHDLAEHSKDVYQEGLAVPLFVRAPGQTGGRVVRERVSLVDVPRLVLEHFPADLRTVLEPVFPHVPGAHPITAEIHYTRAKDLFDPRWGGRFDRVRRALFDGDLKYVHSSDGRHELYDLARDPGEERDLLARDPARGAPFARRLEAFERAHRGAPRDEALPDLAERELEALRDLGYAGSEDEGSAD